MKIIRVLFLASLALVLPLLTGCQKCIRGHNERHHHAAWVQMMPMMAGKVMTMIPVFHPAYDSDDFVCDEYNTDKLPPPGYDY